MESVRFNFAATTEDGIVLFGEVKIIKWQVLMLSFGNVMLMKIVMMASFVMVQSIVFPGGSPTFTNPCLNNSICNNTSETLKACWTEQGILL